MENFEKEVIERLAKIETDVQSFKNICEVENDNEKNIAILFSRLGDLENDNKNLKGALITIACGLIVAFCKWIFKM